jgi:actin-related protein
MNARHLVNLGGDDITAFYTYLLRQSAFPYKEVNLANQYDWLLMEQLKKDACTLLDVSDGIRLRGFAVRRAERLNARCAAESCGCKSLEVPGQAEGQAHS